MSIYTNYKATGRWCRFLFHRIYCERNNLALNTIWFGFKIPIFGRFKMKISFVPSPPAQRARISTLLSFCMYFIIFWLSRWCVFSLSLTYTRWSWIETASKSSLITNANKTRNERNYRIRVFWVNATHGWYEVRFFSFFFIVIRSFRNRIQVNTKFWGSTARLDDFGGVAFFMSVSEIGSELRSCSMRWYHIVNTVIYRHNIDYVIGYLHLEPI